MKTTLLLDFCNAPMRHIDNISEHNEPLVIMRPENKSIVMITMEEYNKLKAFEYKYIQSQTKE